MVEWNQSSQLRTSGALLRNGASCPVNSRILFGHLKVNQPSEGLCTRASLTPQNTTQNSPKICTYKSSSPTPIQFRLAKHLYAVRGSWRKEADRPHIWPASTLASLVVWCRSIAGHNTRENKRLSPHETDSPCSCCYCIKPPWQENDQWRADIWYCKVHACTGTEALYRPKREKLINPTLCHLTL